MPCAQPELLTSFRPPSNKMLAIVLFTASLLLFALVFMLARALDYVRQHPEVLIGNAAQAYAHCQITLQQVIERSKTIENTISPDALIAWQAPNGHFYTVSGRGVEEQRSGSRVYHLAWSHIGGVGVRLQAGFKVVDANRDGLADTRYTTGYSFFLLIVPVSGDTMTIRIPTPGRADAVEFVAQTLALATHLKKRVNVFGFNKPPAPHRQRVPRV
jgi:hypothetical protein